MRTNPFDPRRAARSAFATVLAALSFVGWLLVSGPVAGQDPDVPTLPPAGRVGDGPFGSPHPDAAAELSHFAFLIGHWQCDVEYLGADWKTPQKGDPATWTAYYALDGHAIMDDFRGGFGPQYIATTFRAWDRRAKTWKGYWLQPQVGFWSEPLIGEKVDDGMLLRTRTKARSPEGEVVDVELKYRFRDIRPDRFRWQQDSSLDGGRTWQEATTTIECRRLAGPG